MPAIAHPTDYHADQIFLKNFGPDDPFKGFSGGVAIGGPADRFSTGQVMRFDVDKDSNVPINPVTAGTDGTDLRPVLGSIPVLVPDVGVDPRSLALFEGLDNFGRLQPLLGTLAAGSLVWDDAITENPDLDATEVWEVYNTTEDAHPIHLHLVAFRIIDRESFTGTVEAKEQVQHDGKIGLGATLLENTIVPGEDASDPAPWEDGWKDTMVMLPGQVSRIIATFDRPGRYVWHCHILSHEDHEMMRPFHVGPIPGQGRPR
jgi:spore coat protein A